MLIAERFYSIQGEGKLSGVPSAFIRVSGCNLRCHWCDTPYASWSPEGQELGIDELAAWAAALPTRHAVLTGGEPAIMPQTPQLCERLREIGFHITLETAASVFTPAAISLASLSPKLSNSTPWEREGGRFARAHESSRLRPEVIQQFIDTAPEFQLKFVVADPKDLDEIQSLLTRLRGWSPPDVLLMPEGIEAETLASRTGWVSHLCKQTGFRYCPRLHIALYGNQRGT